MSLVHQILQLLSLSGRGTGCEIYKIFFGMFQLLNSDAFNSFINGGKS